MIAKPETLADGSINLMKWNCIIPVRANSGSSFRRTFRQGVCSAPFVSTRAPPDMTIDRRCTNALLCTAGKGCAPHAQLMRL